MILSPRIFTELVLLYYNPVMQQDTSNTAVQQVCKKAAGSGLVVIPWGCCIAQVL